MTGQGDPLDMSSAAIDLDAYFARIGHSGACAPTLDVLRALCRLQTRTIPFENLDPLLGRTPALDLVTLQDKLVRARRGGYCYEQNLLLLDALRTIGFEARGLAARVLTNAPAGTLTARTHMLLHVVIEGRDHIADVGFGRTTPTGPLLLETGIEQRTAHETYRIDSAGNEFDLSVWIAGRWVLMYRFLQAEHLPADYAVYNHFVATHPSSFFRDRIVAALADEGGRHVLFDDRLAYQHRDGRRDERILDRADDLLETLARPFGIEVPDEPGLRAAFERIKAMA